MATEAVITDHTTIPVLETNDEAHNKAEQIIQKTFSAQSTEVIDQQAAQESSQKEKASEEYETAPASTTIKESFIADLPSGYIKDKAEEVSKEFEGDALTPEEQVSASYPTEEREANGTDVVKVDEGSNPESSTRSQVEETEKERHSDIDEISSVPEVHEKAIEEKSFSKEDESEVTKQASSSEECQASSELSEDGSNGTSENLEMTSNVDKNKDRESPTASEHEAAEEEKTEPEVKDQTSDTAPRTDDQIDLASDKESLNDISEEDLKSYSTLPLKEHGTVENPVDVSSLLLEASEDKATEVNIEVAEHCDEKTNIAPPVVTEVTNLEENKPKGKSERALDASPENLILETIQKTDSHPDSEVEPPHGVAEAEKTDPEVKDQTSGTSSATEFERTTASSKGSLDDNSEQNLESSSTFLLTEHSIVDNPTDVSSLPLEASDESVTDVNIEVTEHCDEKTNVAPIEVTEATSLEKHESNEEALRALDASSEALETIETTNSHQNSEANSTELGEDLQVVTQLPILEDDKANNGKSLPDKSGPSEIEEDEETTIPDAKLDSNKIQSLEEIQETDTSLIAGDGDTKLHPEAFSELNGHGSEEANENETTALAEVTEQTDLTEVQQSDELVKEVDSSSATVHLEEAETAHTRQQDAEVEDIKHGETSNNVYHHSAYEHDGAENASAIVEKNETTVAEDVKAETPGEASESTYQPFLEIHDKITRLTEGEAGTDENKSEIKAPEEIFDRPTEIFKEQTTEGKGSSEEHQLISVEEGFINNAGQDITVIQSDQVSASTDGTAETEANSTEDHNQVSGPSTSTKTVEEEAGEAIQKPLDLLSSGLNASEETVHEVNVGVTECSDENSSTAPEEVTRAISFGENKLIEEPATTSNEEPVSVFQASSEAMNTDTLETTDRHQDSEVDSMKLEESSSVVAQLPKHEDEEANNGNNNERTSIEEVHDNVEASKTEPGSERVVDRARDNEVDNQNDLLETTAAVEDGKDTSKIDEDPENGAGITFRKPEESVVEESTDAATTDTSITEGTYEEDVAVTGEGSVVYDQDQTRMHHEAQSEESSMPKTEVASFNTEKSSDAAPDLETTASISELAGQVPDVSAVHDREDKNDDDAHESSQTTESTLQEHVATDQALSTEMGSTETETDTDQVVKDQGLNSEEPREISTECEMKEDTEQKQQEIDTQFQVDHSTGEDTEKYLADEEHPTSNSTSLSTAEESDYAGQANENKLNKSTEEETKSNGTKTTDEEVIDLAPSPSLEPTASDSGAIESQIHEAAKDLTQAPEVPPSAEAVVEEPQNAAENPIRISESVFETSDKKVNEANVEVDEISESKDQDDKEIYETEINNQTEVPETISVGETGSSQLDIPSKQAAEEGSCREENCVTSAEEESINKENVDLTAIKSDEAYASTDATTEIDQRQHEELSEESLTQKPDAAIGNTENILDIPSHVEGTACNTTSETITSIQDPELVEIPRSVRRDTSEDAAVSDEIQQRTTPEEENLSYKDVDEKTSRVDTELLSESGNDPILDHPVIAKTVDVVGEEQNEASMSNLEGQIPEVLAVVHKEEDKNDEETFGASTSTENITLEGFSNERAVSIDVASTKKEVEIDQLEKDHTVHSEGEPSVIEPQFGIKQDIEQKEIAAYKETGLETRGDDIEKLITEESDCQEQDVQNKPNGSSGEEKLCEGNEELLAEEDRALHLRNVVSGEERKTESSQEKTILDKITETEDNLTIQSAEPADDTQVLQRSQNEQPQVDVVQAREVSEAAQAKATIEGDFIRELPPVTEPKTGKELTGENEGDATRSIEEGVEKTFGTSYSTHEGQDNNQDGAEVNVDLNAGGSTKSHVEDTTDQCSDTAEDSSTLETYKEEPTGENIEEVRTELNAVAEEKNCVEAEADFRKQVDSSQNECLTTNKVSESSDCVSSNPAEIFNFHESEDMKIPAGKEQGTDAVDETVTEGKNQTQDVSSETEDHIETASPVTSLNAASRENLELSYKIPLEEHHHVMNEVNEEEKEDPETRKTSYGNVQASSDVTSEMVSEASTLIKVSEEETEKTRDIPSSGLDILGEKVREENVELIEEGDETTGVAPEIVTEAISLEKDENEKAVEAFDVSSDSISMDTLDATDMKKDAEIDSIDRENTPSIVAQHTTHESGKTDSGITSIEILDGKDTAVSETLIPDAGSESKYEGGEEIPERIATTGLTEGHTGVNETGNQIEEVAESLPEPINHGVEEVQETSLAVGHSGVNETGKQIEVLETLHEPINHDTEEVTETSSSLDVVDTDENETEKQIREAPDALSQPIYHAVEETHETDTSMTVSAADVNEKEKQTEEVFEALSGPRDPVAGAAVENESSTPTEVSDVTNVTEVGLVDEHVKDLHDSSATEYLKTVAKPDTREPDAEVASMKLEDSSSTVPAIQGHEPEKIGKEGIIAEKSDGVDVEADETESQGTVSELQVQDVTETHETNTNPEDGEGDVETAETIPHAVVKDEKWSSDDVEVKDITASDTKTEANSIGDEEINAEVQSEKLVESSGTVSHLPTNEHEKTEIESPIVEKSDAVGVENAETIPGAVVKDKKSSSDDAEAKDITTSDAIPEDNSIGDGEINAEVESMKLEEISGVVSYLPTHNHEKTEDESIILQKHDPTDVEAAETISDGLVKDEKPNSDDVEATDTASSGVVSLPTHEHEKKEDEDIIAEKSDEAYIETVETIPDAVAKDEKSNLNYPEIKDSTTSDAIPEAESIGVEDIHAEVQRMDLTESAGVVSHLPIYESEKTENESIIAEKPDAADVETAETIPDAVVKDERSNSDNVEVEDITASDAIPEADSTGVEEIHAGLQSVKLVERSSVESHLPKREPEQTEIQSIIPEKSDVADVETTETNPVEVAKDVTEIHEPYTSPKLGETSMVETEKQVDEVLETSRNVEDATRQTLHQEETNRPCPISSLFHPNQDSETFATKEEGITVQETREVPSFYSGDTSRNESQLSETKREIAGDTCIEKVNQEDVQIEDFKTPDAIPEGNNSRIEEIHEIGASQTAESTGTDKNEKADIEESERTADPKYQFVETDQPLPVIKLLEELRASKTMIVAEERKDPADMEGDQSSLKVTDEILPQSPETESEQGLTSSTTEDADSNEVKAKEALSSKALYEPEAGGVEEVDEIEASPTVGGIEKDGSDDEKETATYSGKEEDHESVTKFETITAETTGTNTDEADLHENVHDSFEMSTTENPHLQDNITRELQETELDVAAKKDAAETELDGQNAAQREPSLVENQTHIQATEYADSPAQGEELITRDSESKEVVSDFHNQNFASENLLEDTGEKCMQASISEISRSCILDSGEAEIKEPVKAAIIEQSELRDVSNHTNEYSEGQATKQDDSLEKSFHESEEEGTYKGIIESITAEDQTKKDPTQVLVGHSSDETNLPGEGKDGENTGGGEDVKLDLEDQRDETAPEDKELQVPTIKEQVKESITELSDFETLPEISNEDQGLQSISEGKVTAEKQVATNSDADSPNEENQLRVADPEFYVESGKAGSNTYYLDTKATQEKTGQDVATGTKAPNTEVEASSVISRSNEDTHNKVELSRELGEKETASSPIFNEHTAGKADSEMLQAADSDANNDVSLMQDYTAATTYQEAEVQGLKAGVALEAEAEKEAPYEKNTVDKENKELVEKDTTLDSEGIHSSNKDTQYVEPAVSKEEEFRADTAKIAQVETVKADEEEEGDEHNGTVSSSDSPVMVEASSTRDIEVKTPPKKSHNILSGVGSKVKHSIAKVKKAIRGKSPNPKTSPKEDKKEVVSPSAKTH